MDGVAIAIRNNIQHKVEDDFLSETLSVVLNTTDGPLTIATSYLPPRRPFIPLPDFLRLFRRQHPVYMLGDLNARHAHLGNNTTNQVGRDLLHLIRHQTVIRLGPDFPTYHGPLSSTTPDIILANRFAHLHHAIKSGPLTTSDHVPVILDLSSSPILTPIPTILSYKKTNWENFKQDDRLQMREQQDISRGTLEDIDAALNSWTQTVKSAIDTYIPKNRYKIDPHPRPSRQTAIIKIQYQALREESERTGWTIEKYRRYTQLRLSLQESRREEAERYWDRTLTDLAAKHKEPKIFWRKLKSLSGRDCGTSTYLIDDNRQRRFTDGEKETIHTRKWEQVFQKDDDEHDDNDEVLDYMRENQHRVTPHNNADPARLPGTFPLTCKISTQEIKLAISSSKTTSPGKSGINKTVLSNLPDQALERLRDIFNASLSAGYFPDDFKEAEMRMIPKTGTNSTRPENYRPISLLEVPGKLLERIITRRLRDHLEGEQLHNQGQYGFRRGRGTTHAIAMATETLAIHHSAGHCSNLILRDVSKAFDKVWHLGLKYKLLHLGLPGPLDRLLCDFLEDRTARVKVGNHRGRPFSLETGVPQGSVLSPILYTIFTMDSPTSAAGLNIQYADDITQIIYYPGKSRRMLNTRTDREVTRINNFEETWRIRTHMNKFKVIPIAARNPPPLLINEDAVEYNPKGKMLGLTVSSRGYSSHIKGKVLQAKSALGRLFRFRDLDQQLKRQLIKTLVIPVITYPPVPTHALSKTSILKLQRVQNAALKFTTNHRWDSYIPMETLHTDAGVPAINVRLHELAKRVWERLEMMDGEQYRALRELHVNHDNDSYWFPRSLIKLQGPPPEPMYV